MVACPRVYESSKSLYKFFCYAIYLKLTLSGSFLPVLQAQPAAVVSGRMKNVEAWNRMKRISLFIREMSHCGWDMKLNFPSPISISS